MLAWYLVEGLFFLFNPLPCQELQTGKAIAEEMGLTLTEEDLKFVKGVGAFAATTVAEGMMVACCSPSKSEKTQVAPARIKATLDTAWKGVTENTKIFGKDINGMVHKLVASKAVEKSMSLKEVHA